jgi:peptidoglycan/xylan/chitin deacetylase (PgdA/CDA1 family)
MEFSFQEYMRRTPVYLSSMHIKKMMKEGFEFGSHGIDHPLFSLLKSRETLDHISESVTDLQQRYGMKYKYFAFPFTDYGVQDETIEGLFREHIIDSGFGTAGLKDDRWSDYHQRIPMELLGMDARRTLRGELNRRRLRILTGRNMTDRGDPSNAPDYVD